MSLKSSSSSDHLCIFLGMLRSSSSSIVFVASYIVAFGLVHAEGGLLQVLHNTTSTISHANSTAGGPLTAKFRSTLSCSADRIRGRCPSPSGSRATSLAASAGLATWSPRIHQNLLFQRPRARIPTNRFWLHTLLTYCGISRNFSASRTPKAVMTVNGND
jgi:hypothetical protein